MTKSSKSPDTVRRQRGRPPAENRRDPDYKDQLIWRKAREHAGLSQPQFAKLIDMSVTYVGELENGIKRHNADTLAKFRSVPEVNEYVTNGESLGIPISYVINKDDIRETETNADMTPIPRRRRDLLDCVAVEIADDSADKDFAPATVLYLRRVGEGDRLLVGQPAVARFKGADGEWTQALYGILDRAVTGDLMLITRSHNPAVPSSRLLQAGSDRLRSMPQRILDCLPREHSFDYSRSPSDAGDVLGVVVYALGPV